MRITLPGNRSGLRLNGQQVAYQETDAQENISFLLADSEELMRDSLQQPGQYHNHQPQYRAATRAMGQILVASMISLVARVQPRLKRNKLIILRDSVSRNRIQ